MSEQGDVTILVVDDNEIKRYGVVRVLRQAGFQTIEAETGEEALRLASRKPDLIVLDVKLPDISGFEVCRAVKEDPDLANIKVLHVSATYTDTDHRVEGLSQGADGYLVQPVDPGELVETVRALLRLREAEETSRSAAREWRATFDALSDGLLVLNERGTVQRCNRAMAGILGKRISDVLGLPYTEVFTGVLGAGTVPPLSGPDAATDPISFDAACGNRYFTVMVDPIRADGPQGSQAPGMLARTTGAVCVFTDITERKRLEEELRCRAEALATADRAKDEFLAMLGHELRNPLGAISNAAELLRVRGGENPSLQKPLDILKRQLSHTSRLVDDLLDVSRITRSKLTLRREKVDLTVPARRALDAAVPTYQDAGQTFVVDIAPAPLWVEGDLARLEQVVGNLLNNACKYTPPSGRIEITVAEEEGQAVVRVKDNGQGISPAMLPTIFDLFAQEDRSLDRSKGGLGIGLTLVKRLVEMHGGTVRADSEGPGHGSTFTVRLPLAEHARRRATANRPSCAGAEAPRRRHVLVVEDNEDAALTLRSLLEAWGHDVQVAPDGPAALKAVENDRPDIVLLDIGLPGMDGYQVAQRLKAMLPAPGPILVALTGYGQEEDRRRAREAGFHHHVVKPVPAEALLQILAEPVAA